MNDLRMGRVFPGMALLCLFITACGSGYNNKAEADYATADSVSYAYNSDTSQLPQDRLMIRKAEMNFKVKELQKTSQKISAITAHCGGEVWNNHLKTDIQNTISKKISADSLLEVITYRQTNELTIRVPSKNLDSLLIQLEGLSQLLHEKQVTTENVSLEYLSHELKSKNMSRTQIRHENNVTIKKSNLEQYTAAELVNSEIQNGIVDHQIQNLALMDEVKYSTVSVSIYQDTEAYKNIVANLQFNRFEPGFGASVVMAVQDGWDFMLGAILFLIKIWPLYLFATGLFFLIRALDKFRPKTFVEK
jgi:hypothetical protein